ncbi:22271_t:CDS:2, partial [Gigaspora rosea]
MKFVLLSSVFVAVSARWVSEKRSICAKDRALVRLLLIFMSICEIEIGGMVLIMAIKP